MLHVVLSALQQTLIFLPIVFGIYISYELLKVTDLTVEGSFVLGAAIFARLVTSGFDQGLSILLALAGGMLAGIGVTLMQRFAKIDSLIASILAVFMMYSINFGVMDQPNISLLNNKILLQNLQAFHLTGLWFFLLGFTALLVTLLMLLLHSRIGLRLRAFGVNATLLKRLGHSPVFYLGLGLGIGNMLAALCGVLTAQLNGYSDIHMGFGVALTAIGAVVIGTQLIQNFLLHTERYSAGFGLFSCFIGAYIYFLVLNGFLYIGINPIYLKLFLGLLLVVFLSTAHYSRRRGVRAAIQ